MKHILLILLLFSSAAFAADTAIYRAKCGMQTSPAKGQAPDIFAVRDVEIASGQTLEIYRQGKTTYSAYFLAPEGSDLYMLNLYAEEGSGKNKKVIQANASSHDLNALQEMIVGLYPSRKRPTVFCGTQM